MSKIGFFDPYANLMATTEGECRVAPVYAPGTGPTMALDVDGVIVARAEDVDGLRWVVEAGMVKIVNRELVRRATLGDSAIVFAASAIKTLD